MHTRDISAINRRGALALLITVIGRVIIQLRRSTDWLLNELTRRGPVRELES